jgi:hypothetical protein
MEREDIKEHGTVNTYMDLGEIGCEHTNLLRINLWNTK